MNIVCGTDFSEHADHVAKLAGQLAKRFGDRLILIHCLDWNRYMSAAEMAGLAGPFDPSIEASLVECLEERAKPLRELGIEVEPRLICRPPASALVQEAEALTARFIVIGGHRGSAVSGWLLGSVATVVSQTATRPVLVVRKSGDRLAQWATSMRDLRAVVAVDPGATTHAGIQWVTTMRGNCPVNSTFLCAFVPDDEFKRLGLTEGDDEERLQQASHLIRHEMEERLEHLPGAGTVHLEVMPYTGALGEYLDKMAKDFDADVLVLGGHRRSIWGRIVHGSTTGEAIRSGDVPVLCVPNSAVSLRAEHVPGVHTILTATDFSSVGNQAIAQAYALLRSTGGVVHLCHVVVDEEPGNEASRARQQHIEEKLRRLIPDDAEFNHIHTNLRIIYGRSPALALTQAAERYGADLVALGTHGLSGLRHALMGSVSQDVLRLSRKPLLLIRNAAA